MRVTILGGGPSISASTPEYVERKGAGHPDTLCDAIAERASRYYSLYCLQRFDRVAHHWFDKVMLVGGESRLDYGVGDLIKPYRVLFAGKAAHAVGTRRIPLRDILRKAAADVLSETLVGFDPSRHLRVHVLVVDHRGASRESSRYRPTSVSDLVALGGSGGVSNDCNVVAAFAPFTVLESAVLSLERFLNDREYKERHGEVGSDIKLLGMRTRESYRFTVNVPLLGSRVASRDHYAEAVARLRSDMRAYLDERFGIEAAVTLNADDATGRPYLLALGSAADTGDVGVVGRGNRINGLITPMRPMSIEAAAGKNPLDHTGKLYSVLAQRLALDINRSMEKSVEVFISTSKEAPLNAPVAVTVRVADWRPTASQTSAVGHRVQDAFADVAALSAELIHKGVVLW